MRLTDRAGRILILAAAGLAGLVLALTGLSAPVDRAFDGLRFDMLSRPSSGQTVIVEQDAASVARIARWPWSRANYARLVDRLRVAGARSITFDVDVSSPGDPAGDAAFAAALARADGLVALPTFGQTAGSNDGRTLDRVPLPILRPHVALASVSIQPDDDSIVRRAPFATVTQGIPHPSLSSWIAHRSGFADEFYPIDYGIDPVSIPRLSFVAVRDGAFPPALVRGRDVLVGATAIELGDRYGTPRWGVIPGVVVQALGAETLRAGVPVLGDDVPVVLAALMLGTVVLTRRRVRTMTAALVVAVVLLLGGALALQGWAGRLYPLGAGLIVLALVGAGRAASIVAARLRTQRMTDEATGLPNRPAMEAAARPARARLVAVAQMADLATLQAVVGADGALDVVRHVVERLRAASKDGIVYRLADRTFGFVPGTRHGDDDDAADDIDALFAPLQVEMLRPVEAGGRRIDVHLAIGIAERAESGVAAALANAALAADQALAQRLFWRRFESDLSALGRRLSLMGELDEALADGGIAVHYQPKLAIAQQRIGSVEALVRWNHRHRGPIGPDEFVPLAEQSDRIGPLTLFVIERVMRDMAEWRGLGHDVTAAVNISATLVASPAFNRQVRALLERRLAEPGWLIFEVTESATLDDPAAARTALIEYRKMGIAISMDDYGTGQSTLTYLRELPLSELKIDRSFVQQSHLNRNDAVLVRSTIDLAHDLGLKVVAEGVEDEGCLAFLASVGCDYVQGYLVSRPVEKTRLLELLDQDGRAAKGKGIARRIVPTAEMATIGVDAPRKCEVLSVASEPPDA